MPIRMISCVKCGKEMDPFMADQLSVGMTGQACGPCGRKMEREQQDKIDDFTRRAEAKGLVVSYEVSNDGHAHLVAKPPEEKSDGEATPAGEEDDGRGPAHPFPSAPHWHGHNEGHEGPLGAPAAGEVDPGVPGPAEGSKAAEAELEAEAEVPEPDPADP